MDPERMLVNWLNASLDGATAYYEVPSPRPAAFATVALTGDSEPLETVRRPVLEMTCWALERDAARGLLDACLEAVAAMPDEIDGVFHAAVAGRFRDRDPDSPGAGPWRYHAVVQLTIND